jgi:hypothetical protein
MGDRKDTESATRAISWLRILVPTSLVHDGFKKRGGSYPSALSTALASCMYAGLAMQ